MKRKRKLGKKGSLLDLFFVGIVLLFFGITLLISFKISTDYNSEIQGLSTIPTEAKTMSTQMLSYYPGVLDNSFLLLTFGMAISVFILAALVRIHPIFIPLYFIGLGFVIFFSGILSNVYQEMASTSGFATQASSLVFTSQILNFLPFIVGIFGTILMFVMYKTWTVSQI